MVIIVHQYIFITHVYKILYIIIEFLIYISFIFCDLKRFYLFNTYGF